MSAPTANGSNGRPQQEGASRFNGSGSSSSALSMSTRPGSEALLRAVGLQGQQDEKAGSQTLRRGGVALGAFVVLLAAWAAKLSESKFVREWLDRQVAYVLVDAHQQTVNATVDFFVHCLEWALRLAAVGLLAFAAFSLAAGAYASLKAAGEPQPELEGLTANQRRLLGLPAATTPAAAAKTGLLPGASSPYLTSPPTYLSPPSSRLRSHATPLSSSGSRLPSGGSFGSGGGGRRRAAYGRRSQGALAGAALSFGGGADEQVQGFLEEYRQELLTSSANGAATAAGAAEAAKAPGVLPGTPDIYLQPALGMMGVHMHSPPPPVVQYKESPVSAASLGVGGKGAGSPADQRWDAAEWARTLQRLGLDAQRLGQYVDNLRGALYSEVVALLDRLGEVVTDLEARYGVPRELMLDLRATSATGYSLETHLAQAQQHDPARVKEFLALKRVLREGFNWRELFDYVTRRLEELTEDSYLSAYDHARRGTIRDRNVSIELPTDADLLMHVFLWRCDSLSEHRLSEQDQPFIKHHFLQTLPGEEPRSLRGRNLIVRHGTSPPYFYVVENGAIHRVPRGKDNAFTAIVLFLFLARRDRWLPTYNAGYRRLLEAVFGSAFDRSPVPPARGADNIKRVSVSPGVGRLSSTPERR